MLKPGKISISITSPILAALCAIFVVLADNRYFWNALFKIISISTWNGIAFSVGIFVILSGIISTIMLLLSFRLIFKPALIIMLLLSATVSYFQTEYSVIIDKSMIQNVVETDTKEAVELISFSLLTHLALFGVLPSLAVAFVRVRYQSLLKESLLRVLWIASLVIVTGGFVWANYKNFVLIGREHRELRLFINPTAPVFEAYKFARNKLTSKNTGPIQQIGLDAKQNEARRNQPRKTVVVLVVGETARAKSFSLNGYERETNPELAKDGVISFSNAYSCGTSTAESVPCIFSHFGRDDYSSNTAGRYENILDVLSRAGIQVLWRDNNSGCKGVCERIEYEDVSRLPEPTMCGKSECFDELLLRQLPERIRQASTDNLIVLHQKGSHGPAYFKRHPENFTRFQPECTNSAPQNCKREDLLNAYDNTILYTDHVLHLTIEALKSVSDQYDTVMLYASDHGESLGENGIYLHGLPYMLAPDEQRHIPMITWVSDAYAINHKLDKACLSQHRDEPYSHDNIKHALMGLFSVQTSIYKPEYDLFYPCTGHHS